MAQVMGVDGMMNNLRTLLIVSPFLSGGEVEGTYRVSSSMGNGSGRCADGSGDEDESS